MQDSSPLFLKVARLGLCHGVCKISVASRLELKDWAKSQGHLYVWLSLFLTFPHFRLFYLFPTSHFHLCISQMCLSMQGFTIHSNYICFAKISLVLQ